MLKAITLSTAMLISTVNNPSFAANVSNISAESFAQYGKEDAYWVVSVSCDDNDTVRIVQRKTDQDTWCPKNNNSLCSEDKQIAYKNACSAAYSEELQKAQFEQQRKEKTQRAAQEQATARQQAALRQQEADAQKEREKLKIEEDLLKNQQQRISLSKRQLEIENRVNEIDKILKQDDE